MIIRKNQIIILLLGTVLFTGFISCNKKDKIDTNPALTLSFSTDTVFFDTVFTTIGTVTKRLLVYNNNNSKIVVSSIQLAGDTNVYKLNIDGKPGSILRDVEIPGKDSIFIFIRAIINPTNQNKPFVIVDSILFNTNGNPQNVKVIAWGQNAHFYKSATLKGNIVWDDSLKPYVIFGFVRVDTGANLTLMAGTKVYLHKNAYLAVSSQATLKLEGILNHPIRFQGDRLDPFYRDLPGQWDGIYLEKGSRQNEIKYAIIKNGSFGIFVDTLSSPSDPTLKIDNSIIQNMTGTGLSAYASNVISTNCVIGDCGSAAIKLAFGGSYDFSYLTIGNFWGGSVRLSPSLYISNYIYDNSGIKISNSLTKAYFVNCIIYGNDDEEIMLDSLEIAQFNYTFNRGLLKTKKSISDPLHYIECFKNEDPGFVDVMNFNYAIDSISPAIQKGVPIMEVQLDINGADRGSTPDLGAYQYVKKR